MRRLSVLLSLVVLVLLIAACGQAGPTPEAEPAEEQAAPTAEPTEAMEEAAPTEAPAEQEAEAETDAGAAEADTEMTWEEGCGHEILIGINGDGQSVNPLYGSDSSTIFRTDQISEPLVYLDWETMEPIPWLAESWDVSEDGTTYTFTIREGPKWPDGTPLTAQDFEFTLLTILSPDYTGPWQGLFAGLAGADAMIAGDSDSLDGVQVIDDKTLQLTLAEPNAAFLPIAARHLKPIPKHLLEGEDLSPEHPFMQDPIGVGPYRVAERVPGDHTTLEAKPDYWGEPVCAARITERIIPDMEALSAALESGSVDQMNPLEPRYVLRFQDNPDINVNKTPATIQDALYFNTQNEILADPQVRRAIAMTVDMNQFTEQVLSGIQAPVPGPLVPASWAYDPDARKPEQDLEQASQLLADAGYADGFTVRVRTNAGNTTREQMATYLQGQLEQVGVTAEVEFQEWSTFFTGVVDGDFDIVVLSSQAGVPDPDTLYNDYHTNGGNNYGKYSNPEVDALLEEARATQGTEARKELYTQVQELLVQDLPRSWGYEYLADTATRANISNVRPSALGPMWDAKYWRKN